MKFYDMPIETSWKIYLGGIIKILNKSISSQITQTHISTIRQILYKIFITNINGTEIIKELLNQMLLKFTGLPCLMFPTHSPITTGLFFALLIPQAFKFFFVKDKGIEISIGELKSILIFLLVNCE